MTLRRFKQVDQLCIAAQGLGEDFRQCAGWRTAARNSPRSTEMPLGRSISIQTSSAQTSSTLTTIFASMTTDSLLLREKTCMGVSLARVGEPTIRSDLAHATELQDVCETGTQASCHNGTRLSRISASIQPVLESIADRSKMSMTRKQNAWRDRPAICEDSFTGRSY